MKVDKQDFEKVLNKVELKVNKRYITDLKMYSYWAQKSSDSIDLMEQTSNDKTKYFSHMKQALLYEFEKNRYCRLSRKEFIILFTLLKFYNSNNPKDKLYMDEKGRRTYMRKRQLE